MKKLIILFLFFIPFLTVKAQDSGSIENFEAQVVEVIEQKKFTDQNGEENIRQNLLLRGLSGSWRGEEIRYDGIGAADTVSAQLYEVGDKVLVQKTTTPEGESNFYITDYVRRGWLYLLTVIFCLIVLAVGGWKGGRSLLSLVLSFFVIIKFVIPLIVSGYSPLLVSLFGSFIILGLLIYVTEGFSIKSHLAMVSMFFSLAATLGLSVLFSGLARLTGLASEEAGFLIGLTDSPINFRGLLLAGFLIGAVGVLDDVVVGQIEAVRQIKEANPYMSFWKLFRSAYKVGNTHLSAIVNTLFLVYAGASLPLLILFSLGENSSITFSGALNNELIATEIVRTLVGSIGVALSIPISTLLAAKWLKIK